MNKILTVVMVALASTAAFGQLSWATISTTAYDKDTSGGTATSAYTAYLCTKDAADVGFDATTISGVTQYFVDHFDEGRDFLVEASASEAGSKLENGATVLDAAEYEREQYSFMTYFTTDSGVNLVAGSEYLGIILYASGDDYAVRVFSATASSTPTWRADDSIARSAGDAGAWTETIPEPTSGLLMLLGFACLALKRKQA